MSSLRDLKVGGADGCRLRELHGVVGHGMAWHDMGGLQGVLKGRR